jgi:predicted GH43/DUF377 family glycosyl hydrolase
MQWIKKGCIFNISSDFYMGEYSHCHKPTPIIIDKYTLRVYFGVKDKSNKTRISFVDLSIDNLRKIKYVHDKLVLDLGNIGTFDDSGVQVSSIVRIDSNTLYMYYIGWNTSTTVPSRNALGLSVSKDNGITFQRLYEGPILERYKEEPYHVGASDVLFDGKNWKMWYNSGKGYSIINGKPEYNLQIKYAVSANGIDWNKQNIVCIAPIENEIVARPSVIYVNGKYLMWYSRRSIFDFRTNPSNSYKIGYAESMDGIIWNRKDDTVNIDITDKLGDWDYQMMAYPYVIQLNNQLVMFYNGNGFGKTGFGYAVANSCNF